MAGGRVNRRSVARLRGGCRRVLVKAKLAVDATPGTLAVTLYDPIIPLAVKAGAVATPCAFVVAVADAPEPKAPLAPEAGAVNVTVAPETGLLPESLTVAWRAVANAVFTGALWPPPAVAAMLAGAGGSGVAEASLDRPLVPPPFTAATS